MAFQMKDLEIKFRTRRHTHAYYHTDDTAATVDTAGYFNEAAPILPTGSRIDVTVDAAGTPAWGTFVVTSNNGTVVDVADIIGAPGADTD